MLGLKLDGKTDVRHVFPCLYIAVANTRAEFKERAGQGRSQIQHITHMHEGTKQWKITAMSPVQPPTCTAHAA